MIKELNFELKYSRVSVIFQLFVGLGLAILLYQLLTPIWWLCAVILLFIGFIFFLKQAQISQIEYLDSENLLVTINIPSDANLGDYNVNVFNTSLGLYSSIPFGFRVNNSLNTLDYLKPVVLSVSPNPAKQYLDLILNEDLAQNAKCEIFDTSGKVVFNYKLKSKTTNINIEKLVKGNYILKVTNGTKRITKKIIKN